MYSWGGAAAGLQGGTRGGGSYPIDQTGVEAWGPEPGGPRPPGQAAQSPRHAAGMGALGRSRNKLRQEQSESPPCELPQEMSTDRPPCGVHGGGARGRQGGARGHHGGDDNTVRHTHTRCGSPRERGGQQSRGPSDRPQPRGRPGACLTGPQLCQAGLRACPELRHTRNASRPLGKHSPHPTLQARPPWPSPVAQPGVTREPWGPALASGSSGASHSW